MDKRKVIYYEDELNDEFSVARITPKTIDGDWVYCHNSAFGKFAHFFWYRIVAMPVAFLFCKLKFRHKKVNAGVIKKTTRGGYFLYGNHTQDIGDAFIPNLIDPATDKYIIVHPNNVSIKIIGSVTPSLGALPLPDDMNAYTNFVKAVDGRIKEKKAVVIYPEAHIWPYYTKIRPFSDASFHYPVRLDAPVFAFTNTYHKRKFGKEPRIITYIDGPFYPDKSLPVKERKKKLRDEVYEAMCRAAERSDVEIVKYIKKNG